VNLKAMGRAINKTVTIAEIIKRRVPSLHQITVIDSTDITDVWEPIEEGLETLETTRHVSSIQITLSTKQLDPTVSGYQPPLPADQVKPIPPIEEQTKPASFQAAVGRGSGRRGRGVGRVRGRFRSFRGGRGVSSPNNTSVDSPSLSSGVYQTPNDQLYSQTTTTTNFSNSPSVDNSYQQARNTPLDYQQPDSPLDGESFDDSGRRGRRGRGGVRARGRGRGGGGRRGQRGSDQSLPNHPFQASNNFISEPHQVPNTIGDQSSVPLGDQVNPNVVSSDRGGPAGRARGRGSRGRGQTPPRFRNGNKPNNQPSAPES